MHPLIDSMLPFFSYCENEVGAITQPLNFLSCAVFWLGAVWLWSKRSEDDETPSFHQVTSIMLFLLGLTGMVWHVSGNPVFLALDLFIMFLLLIVVASVLINDVLRWDMSKGMATLIVIVMVSALLKDESTSMLPQNGGLFLPTLFFLAMVALKVQSQSEEVTVYILSASYILFFGLIFRSADSLLCHYFPQGLHFLWHIMLVIALVYISKTLEAMKQIPWPKEKA